MDVKNSHSTTLSTIKPRAVARPVSPVLLAKTQEAALSEQDIEQLRQLKARDQVVRSHEAAHLAAGSGIVLGGANFSFQRGPDGVQYAIGGEVNIDTSKVSGDPHATLQKAQKIQAAALAPMQPSSQDLNVAARAAQMAVEARAEISKQLNPNSLAMSQNATTDNQETKRGNTLDIKA